jgi:predicted cupin superfamily sugar epimerase
MKLLNKLFVAIALIGSAAAANDGGRQMTANEVIEKLGLKPLPEEGGYYRETYKCGTMLSARNVGIESTGTRSMSTAIYYLLVPHSFSALHRVKSDEIFHYYSGDPAEMIQIGPNGKISKFILGADLLAGQQPQIVVPAGTWQALRLLGEGKWSLMGTTVSPGFEFEDFEVGERNRMLQEFPHLESEILRFTRGPNERTHE